MPTRIQAATGVANPALTVAATFSAPPTVGHTILVALQQFTTTPPVSVVDAYGTTYTLACAATHVSLPNRIAIYLGTVGATGAGFTVTVTGPTASNYMTLAVIETTPLVLDVWTARNNALAAGHVTVGPTAALTGANAFLVGMIGTTSFPVTVDTATPAWLQEIDVGALTLRGEIDSRVLTGVAGTTQSVGWALNGEVYVVALIAAFADGVVPVVPLRGSFVAGEATTVTASRAVAFGLDGATHTHGTSGTLQVYGAVAVTGTVQVDTVTGVTATQLVGRGPGHRLEGVTVGTGLSLTANTLAVVWPPVTYDAPLSDGDLAAADLIFANGECVIVQVPV